MTNKLSKKDLDLMYSEEYISGKKYDEEIEKMNEKWGKPCEKCGVRHNAFYTSGHNLPKTDKCPYE